MNLKKGATKGHVKKAVHAHESKMHRGEEKTNLKKALKNGGKSR